MNEYEILLLLDPDLDDDRQSEIVTRARELVTKGGGTWDLHDVWGRRKLAYAIAKHKRGVYVYLKYLGTGGVVSELERRGARYGLATMCVGVGQGVAMAFERVR